MDGGALSEASAQGGFQVGRTVMLLQKVPDGFFGQLLEGDHAVAGKQINGLPRFIVELDPLSGHQPPPVEPEEMAPRPAWRQCHASIDEKFRSLVRASDRSKRSYSVAM